MTTLLAIVLITAAFGCFAALYFCITIKVKYPFLLNFTLVKNRSLAEVADEAIDYWTGQLNKLETKEQKDYCFEKAHQAHKELMAFEAAANQPVAKAQTGVKIKQADNVILFPPQS